MLPQQARRDYERAADVTADFPMQGGHIPLIANGTNHASRVRANHSPDLGAVPSYGIPPGQAAPQPMGLPQVAQQQRPANRLGWSQNFQDSVSRTRALRSFRSGTYSSLRAQGQDERSAAQSAYAQTQLADADMQTGNGFMNRGLTVDANTRANSLAGADVNESGSRADLNQANAYGATQRANVTLPAEAGLANARAGLVNADVERSHRMLPLEAQQQQAETDRYTHMTPGMVAGQQAQTYGAVAQANATQAQPAMTAKRLAELEKENAALRSQLSQQYSGVRSDNRQLRAQAAKTPNYSDEPTAAPPPAAAAAGAPGQPMSVQSIDEAMQLPPGSVFVTPDGQVRQRH